MSTDKENKETEAATDLAETIVDIESPSAPEEKPKKRSSKLPVFLLFLILLAAGYTFAPQQLKSELSDIVHSLLQPEKQASSIEPELAITPIIEPEPQITELEPVVEAQGPTAPESGAASSDEINRMLTAMENLQSELTSLREEQQTIQETQLSLQKMQLRTRLRWVTNADNHLPQLQLVWAEIALMPSLNSSEHATAQQMLTLAQQRLQNLRNWQLALQSHADALVTPEHQNIIPKYETPWLSWVRDYFSLKAASTVEQQQDQQLRQQLLNSSRNIELEQWPNGKEWQQLRANLQLRLNEADHSTSEAIDLGIPESFDALKADIELLRQTATTWLEGLS